MQPSIHSVVKELRGAGWSQTAIAERVDCAQPTISDIERNPRYEVMEGLGTRLRSLHREVIRPPGRRRTRATEARTG